MRTTRGALSGYGSRISKVRLSEESSREKAMLTCRSEGPGSRIFSE